MGTHSPGPIGKLLVGSVAESVLRTANAPVYVVGPAVVDGASRNFATRTILCGVSLHESSSMVAGFAAELAAEHNARLFLQHVIRPQERQEVLAGRSIDQIEAELVSLIPHELGHLGRPEGGGRIDLGHDGPLEARLILVERSVSCFLLGLYRGQRPPSGTACRDRGPAG